MKKNLITIVVWVGLVLLICAIALLAFSQITILQNTQQKVADSWQITQSFQPGQTVVLDIKAGGDWGSFYPSGASGSYPVQLDVNFQTNTGGETSFSCWYNSTTLNPTGGVGTPILSPINATVTENNASESLEPVSNAIGEASCLVKTDVNVTASLNETSVYDSFGGLSAGGSGTSISPPQLRLLTDIPAYPYPYFYAPGLILVPAGLLVFAYGVYVTFKGGGRRRKVRR